MVEKKWIFLSLLVMTGVVVGGVGVGKYVKMGERLREEEGKRQALILELEGWKKGVEEAEDIELDGLGEEVEGVVEDSGVELALAVNASGEAVEVLLPPITPSSTPSSSSPSTPSSTPLVDPIPSSFTLLPRVQLRADLNETGDLFYKGKMFVEYELKSATPANEDALVLWSGTTEHEVEGDVGLGKGVREAIEYYKNRPPRFTFSPRSPKGWRTGWSIGVGVGYNPLSPSQPISAGVMVVYGVQF